ncbi:hypothetical protein Tco_1270197 [Tanacetum coccineum]
MRIDELHKFSDGTLDDVRTALNDRLKGIRMEYLPQTFWSQRDKANARAMIQAIDKRLKTRRIMRSLERFCSYKAVRLRYSDPMIQPEPEGSTQGYPLVSVEVLRFNTTAGNPVKKILLKLNLSDHRNHKSTRWQSLKMAKRLCLVDDLKMLKITMSNTSSRNKLNPEIKDHYNIFTRESQEYELKTKDEA